MDCEKQNKDKFNDISGFQKWKKKSSVTFSPEFGCRIGLHVFTLSKIILDMQNLEVSIKRIQEKTYQEEQTFEF